VILIDFEQSLISLKTREIFGRSGWGSELLVGAGGGGRREEEWWG
jgi:hypothetical protein